MWKYLRKRGKLRTNKSSWLVIKSKYPQNQIYKDHLHLPFLGTTLSKRKMMRTTTVTSNLIVAKKDIKKKDDNNNPKTKLA